MKTVEVELTFDEIEMLIESMEWAQKAPEHVEGAGYEKLLSRLQTIDNAHTVMLTAAMYDDNLNPFHEMFVEAGRKALESDD